MNVVYRICPGAFAVSGCGCGCVDFSVRILPAFVASSTPRIPELAELYARRTQRLREALLRIGWALGGEAGARLCKAEGMSVCAATLLSLHSLAKDAPLPTPRVLGVDDWGCGAAHPTGTLLVDLERHRPVDVLVGSDDQVLAEWLTSHPGVEIICRDRGASYPRGASKGAPHARQVLDRWYLLKNVSEVREPNCRSAC